MIDQESELKPFMGVTEVARYFGVSRPTIYAWIDRGDLHARRLGGRIQIASADLHRAGRSLPLHPSVGEIR